MSGLRLFYFVGECEMHHVIAYDEADACSVLFEWLAKSGADQEYMEQMPEEPWGDPAEITDGTVTVYEDDSIDGEQRTVGEWIAHLGRGHMSWSEVG